MARRRSPAPRGAVRRLPRLALPAAVLPCLLSCWAAGPWLTGGAAFAGGGGARLRPWADALQSRVTMGIDHRKTKHDKVKREIIKARNAPLKFSSKKFQEMIRKANKVAQEDEWTDEFLKATNNPVGVGGQYVVPPEEVTQILEEIYGTKPSIQVALGKIDADKREVNFKKLEEMRRNRKPIQDRKPARRVSLSSDGITWKYRYTGTSREIATQVGNLGTRNAPEGQAYQDAWISGQSVRYDFDDQLY